MPGRLGRVWPAQSALSLTSPATTRPRDGLASFERRLGACNRCPRTIETTVLSVMTVPSQPSNPHLTDPNLPSFLSASFSPVDYLNKNLPRPSSSKDQSLSALASQTQSHVSTLNAQTSRLSATLTGLTDDILRASSRLAYEVELLRGEAVSLAETLSSSGDLHESILKFVPAGLETATEKTEAPPTPAKAKPLPGGEISSHHGEPSALPQLRTLLHVRQQLQAAIAQFNLALSFTLPPSLLATTASSLISVAPPQTDPDAEAKGQASLSQLRGEVTDLLQAEELEKAKKRVAELRDVCVIWKGTSEERARAKWVDALDGLIEEDVQRRQELDRRKGGSAVPRQEQSTPKSSVEAGSSGPGFLRRLRDEIYME